jgi:hypothetical protein
MLESTVITKEPELAVPDRFILSWTLFKAFVSASVVKLSASAPWPMADTDQLVEVPIAVLSNKVVGVAWAPVPAVVASSMPIAMVRKTVMAV